MSLPAGDVRGALLLCGAGELDEPAAHGVHLDLALEVKVRVVGLAAGLHGGDQGDGEALIPCGVKSFQLIYDGQAFRGDAGAEVAEGLILDFFSVFVGAQEDRVAGGLVAAEPGLLVDDETLDEQGLGDGGVGFLDEGDGLVCAVDAPVNGDGCDERCQDGNDEDLAQDVVEPG